MKKNKEIIILCCILTIGLTALCLYAVNFLDSGLSAKTQDWGSFGSYVAGIIGTCFAAFNIYLVITSLRRQKASSEKQQFESSFFRLIELYRNTLYNLEIEKNYLFPDNREEYMHVFVKPYEALTILYRREQKMVNLYFNMQINGIANEPEDVKVYNYRALNNHFIQTRDFLVIIINSIANIFYFVKTSTHLTTDEKKEHVKTLKNLLTDNEKFFLAIFFVQLKNNIKYYFTYEEIFDFVGPKQWILEPLKIKDEFPFLIPGLILFKNFTPKHPINRYTVSVEEFIDCNFCYQLQLKNKDIELEYFDISFEKSMDGQRVQKAEVPKIGSAYTLDLKSFYLNRKLSSGNLSKEEIVDYLVHKCEFKNFKLDVEAQVTLNGVKYLLRDQIEISLFENQRIKDRHITIGLDIISSVNLSISEDYLIWSHEFFKEN